MAPSGPPLISLILLFFQAIASTSAQTTSHHVIGKYILSESAPLLADSSDCFHNMTVSHFQSAHSKAPSNVISPRFFNIGINHRGTELEDQPCESSNSILAVESTHPYVQDRFAVLNAWASAGGMLPRTQWATERFVKNVEKGEWVVGYDPTERRCGGLILSPGVAYLWYQPGWDYLLGKGFQVRGGVNYLFMTFSDSTKKGCVYEGVSISGTGGPVSDPTNPADATPPDEDGSEGEGNPAQTPLESPVSDSNGDGEEEPPELPDSFGTATDEGEPEPACFPGFARVYMEDGSSRNMTELGIGRKVQVGTDKHSDICFFSHRERKGVFKFARVETEGGKAVVLSEGHYLHSGKGLVAAGSVKIGDEVWVVDGKMERVVKKTIVEGIGRFAPHTLTGYLVVDGIVVSCYTTTVHPVFAHYVLLWPVRWLYRLGLREMLHGWLDEGNEWLRRVLPQGPQVLTRMR